MRPMFKKIFLAGGLLCLATEFIAFRRFQTAEGKVNAALASMPYCCMRMYSND